MAWYRQYRPKTIAELNISNVRQSLQAMMAAGKIPQTLLFAGPKGTGKTSASRIIALMLNDSGNEQLVDQLYFNQATKKKLAFQEPDSSSALAAKVYTGQSFIVNELDAASNRGIDDIRLLKERIALPPQGAKMAVYILDEVHMLTTEAFNALLKVLEEPPAHAVFILATTELQKLPATIVSRCTLVNFRKANDEEILEALERILKAEKINYQQEDLLAITQRADGSFRDAVKILELACQSGQLDLKVLASLLGANNQKTIKELLTAVLAKDPSAVSQIFIDLRAKNINQKNFYQDLFAFLHRDLLINLGLIEAEAFSQQKIDQYFLKQLLAAKLEQESPIPFLTLELALLEIVDQAKNRGKSGGDQGPKHSSSDTSRVESSRKPRSSKKKIETKLLDGEKIKKQLQVETKEELIEPVETVQSIQTSNLSWQKLLQFVAQENFSLSALLKSCQLEGVIGGTAKVVVFYDFHKQQLEQNKYKLALSDYCQQLFDQNLQFNFVLAESKQQKNELLEQAKDVLL